MKKAIITSVLASVLVLAQINNQFAQCKSTVERNEIVQSRNEKGIWVPAAYYKGELIPSVNLPVIEITANGNPENTNGYNLPMVEVTAERTNCKFLPATQYNGEWIAMADLPVIEVVSTVKTKLNMASVFSFDLLFNNSERECKKINY